MEQKSSSGICAVAQTLQISDRRRKGRWSSCLSLLLFRSFLCPILLLSPLFLVFFSCLLQAGVPMEVMGLMLGEFIDDYTVRVVDVFSMPQSGLSAPSSSFFFFFSCLSLDRQLDSLSRRSSSLFSSRCQTLPPFPLICVPALSLYVLLVTRGSLRPFSSSVCLADLLSSCLLRLLSSF